MDYLQAKQLVTERPNWHHSFEIFPGVMTTGNYDPLFMWNLLALPNDLKGVRALDIGPSDGFFSMHMAQRGATVTAVDYREKEAHGFGIMERVTGLRFDYRRANLYSIPELDLGKFDVVLFLGVLYHLPDMMRALQIVKDASRSRVYIETEFDPGLTPGIAASRYYGGSSLNNDITNFWVPNQECVTSMLIDVGLSIQTQSAWGSRLFVQAEVADAAPTHKMEVGYNVVG